MGIEEFYRDKRVLITGNTGFKGSWLSQSLLICGCNPIGYSLHPHTSPNLFTAIGLEKTIKTHYGDIRNLGEVKRVFEREKPEILFHLAAQPIVRESYEDPVYTLETNIHGTINILEAIRQTDSVRSAVIITTDKVYKNKEKEVGYVEEDELGGHDPYSVSKACVELISKSYEKSFFYEKESPRIATARAGNVIGGGDWSKDRIIPDIVRSVYDDQELIIRCPDSMRPWQHVFDPLYGYLLLGKKLFEEGDGYVGAWNFAPEKSSFVPVIRLVNKGLQILGKGEYRIEKDDTKKETKVLKLDSTKAKNKLGWNSQINLDKTLGWTFGWYKNYYEGKNIVDFTNSQIREFFKYKF